MVIGIIVIGVIFHHIGNIVIVVIIISMSILVLFVRLL